jgi:bifunctional lysine-specific demethylase and histidyl-hydroxylase NO66
LIGNLVQEGVSIVANKIELANPSVARFCRMMEKSFSHPFQANAYFTPPESRAFNVHFDDHDVFVIQICGSKSWKIYNRPVVNPLRGTYFDRSKDSCGAMTFEAELETGDCLYIPRGVLHEAIATHESSLHLTVGILVYTWAEFILESLSEVILREECVRAALPLGILSLGESSQEAHHVFRQLTSLLASKVDFESTFLCFVNGSRFPDLRFKRAISTFFEQGS